MNRFKLLYFVIFVINLCRINAQISDKRLCVDEECKVPISLAKTLLRYSSPDSRILSFAPNADITIYSKSAGSREDLWGGEINGKRGYIPKHMVRETKILQKPTLLVDTEFGNETQVPSKVEPDKVQEPYEVVDGTTIYLSPQEINPTSTDSPVQSTALPLETNKIQGAADNSGSSIEEQEAKNSDQNVATESGDQPVTESTEIDDESAVEDDEADDEDEEEEDDDDADEESEEAEELPEDVVNTEASLNSAEPEVTQTKDETNTEEVSSETVKEIQTEDTSIPVPVIADETTLEKESEVIADPIEEPSVNKDLEPSSAEDRKETEPSDIEEAVQPNEAPFEATTLTPEIEVPQPFDEQFIEVTQNPLEATEARIAPEIIPTLPPLGLFAAANVDSGQSQEKTVESTETQPDQNEAKTDDESAIVEDSSKENIDVVDAGIKGDSSNNIEELVGGIKEDSNENSIELEGGIKDSIKENIEELEVASKEELEVASKEELEAASKEDSIKENIEELEAASKEASIKENIEELEAASTEDSIKENTEELAEIVASSENTEPAVEQNGEENEENTGGFFASVLSLFGSTPEDTQQEESTLDELTSTSDYMALPEQKHVDGDDLLSSVNKESFCDAKSEANVDMDFFTFNSDVFLYLVTTAISVIIFLFGYMALDKNKREGPLIARINSLEKELLVVLKEKDILQEKVATESGYETNDRVSNEVVENLQQDVFELTSMKSALEEQVQSLEKELENSTEVGMELNRMLSEILSSESGSDVLKANVEHMQRQLVEQQSTINSVNETLTVTNTENHELRLELELSNKKVLDLQAELDKLLLNVLKIEEEKDTQQSTLEGESALLRQKYEEVCNKFKTQENDYEGELKQARTKVEQVERKLQLKTKEHAQLAETLKQLKVFKNDETKIRSLLEVGDVKAELQVLKSEKQRFVEKMEQNEELKVRHEKKAQAAVEEILQLKQKYDEADKLRVEMQTKLEVLSNYFKDREAQWQKEISKHEALWAEKQGEATSTTERIAFMQEQLQNYKAQTESLKQEIMSQEIELKSQISVLEKKAHENWVSARQAERKLEEAKQEAAQLRHRLTLRERAIQEDKNQHRLQSPIEQNGDMPVSPMESPASPPLLYGARDHITKSPPLPGLPPFLPPPPGVPFMPPPLHGVVPPFIPPPPPNMFPGDHRPPPLGRMSSPPLNSRYSPGSRGYSPYDRNSSSPSDSEYGTSPPHRRGYSPFNSRSDDRRDYKRAPPGRSNGRNLGKGGGSSGSGHSNESLEKISRQQSKV